MLEKYKKLGYIIIIEYNVWLIKEERTGEIVAEIHSSNSSDRKLQLEKYYNKITDK